MNLGRESSDGRTGKSVEPLAVPLRNGLRINRYAQDPRDIGLSLLIAVTKGAALLTFLHLLVRFPLKRPQSQGLSLVVELLSSNEGHPNLDPVSFKNNLNRHNGQPLLLNCRRQANNLPFLQQ